MKNLFLFLAFFSVSVSAVDCSIQYGKGGGREKDGTCFIAFDGSRSYPALSLIPSSLKEETYYKLSFDAELENLPLTIRFQEKNGSVTRFQGCPENTTGKQHFTFYFRTGKGTEGNSSFALYPNPGKAGRGRIGNIRLDALEEFSENLLPEGDFELGSALQARHKRFGEQVEIVDSPAFFSGEKSLILRKNPDDFAALISGDLPAIPGKTVKIRFWGRSRKGTVPGLLYLDFFQQGYSKHFYRTFSFQAEEEWKEFSWSCSIPSDLAAYPALAEGMVRLQFHLLKSPQAAVVCFDNLEYWME